MGESEAAAAKIPIAAIAGGRSSFGLHCIVGVARKRAEDPLKSSRWQVNGMIHIGATI